MRTSEWGPAKSWYASLCAQRYAYGLAPGFMLSCSAVLVLVTLTSSVVLTMCEEPSASSGDAGHPSHEADKFISWLSKVSLFVVAALLDTAIPGPTVSIQPCTRSQQTKPCTSGLMGPCTA